VIRKDEYLPFASTWMELEGVMLSEISRERQFPFHIVKETLLFSNTEIIHCHYGTTYFYFPFLNLFKESETFFFLREEDRCESFSNSFLFSFLVHFIYGPLDPVNPSPEFLDLYR